MQQQELIITPKTKVLQLIETYPQLEDVLIAYVPAFKKLKNPILRKTVASIATLQQAAGVGGVDVADLINTLRKEVGQELVGTTDNPQFKTKEPSWFALSNVSTEFDVREMLARGEHPVAQVMSDLKHFPDDKIYKLIAPFLPAPLIDKASSLGFDHFVSKEADEMYFIYFIKKRD